MARIYSNHQLKGGINIFGIDDSVPLQPKSIEYYSKKQIESFHRYEEERKKLEPEIKRAAAKTTANSNLEFSIKELDDRYVISPISYHNGIYKVSWSRDLLDGGKAYTQENWMEFLQENNSKWSLASGPLYHATIATLFREKDGHYQEEIENLRNMFSEDFKEDWMTTSTRIEYSRCKLDKVIHDYGFSGQWELDAGIVGADGYVNGSFADIDCIEAILGTRDLAEAEKAYEWVSGKKPYLWRLNQKHGTKGMRALVLGVSNFNRFFIGAYYFIYFNRPARGVVCREISTGNKG